MKQKILPLLNVNRIISLLIGTLLIAIATNGILISNHLLSGGLNGISILLHLLFNTKVSLMVVLLNIPLFILGLFFLKKTYLSYSLVGMLMLSFWIEVTSPIIIKADTTLSILIIAGLLHGLGTGIIYRADGCTGGTDIIAKIINQYLGINMATITLSINAIIIALSAYFFDLDIAVLTVSTMFLSSQVANFVVDGLNRKRTLYIITSSQHCENLSQTLLKELHRGVTMIPAVGAYTSEEKYILFTTVSIREVAKAKKIILTLDPEAFMTVTETSQVIGNGRGFSHLSNQ